MRSTALAAEWTLVDVLLVDEVSLIDAALVALINRRLQVLRSKRCDSF